jgi:hypothetical protein
MKTLISSFAGFGVVDIAADPRRSSQIKSGSQFGLWHAHLARDSRADSRATLSN